MAAYRRVYDSRHLQADCQELGSVPESYARQSSMGYIYLYDRREICPRNATDCLSLAPRWSRPPWWDSWTVPQWSLHDEVDSCRTVDELTVEYRSRKTPRSSANSISPSRGAKGRPGPLSLSVPAHYSRCPLSERPLDFYPRDAMLARVLAMALCPCLSVTSRCSVETYEWIGLVLAWELP